MRACVRACVRACIGWVGGCVCACTRGWFLGWMGGAFRWVWALVVKGNGERGGLVRAAVRGEGGMSRNTRRFHNEIGLLRCCGTFAWGCSTIVTGLEFAAPSLQRVFSSVWWRLCHSYGLIVAPRCDFHPCPPHPASLQFLCNTVRMPHALYQIPWLGGWMRDGVWVFSFGDDFAIASRDPRVEVTRRDKHLPAPSLITIFNTWISVPMAHPLNYVGPGSNL